MPRPGMAGKELRWAMTMDEHRRQLREEWRQANIFRNVNGAVRQAKKLPSLMKLAVAEMLEHGCHELRQHDVEQYSGLWEK